MLSAPPGDEEEDDDDEIATEEVNRVFKGEEEEAPSKISRGWLDAELNLEAFSLSRSASIDMDDPPPSISLLVTGVADVELEEEEEEDVSNCCNAWCIASDGDVAHESAKAEKAGRRAGARTERINELAETCGSGNGEEDSTVCVLWSAGL